MAKTMTVGGKVWTEVTDGEKNQWTTTVCANRVDVYSDFYEEEWNVEFNQEGCYSLEATDLESAMREAIRDATE